MDGWMMGRGKEEREVVGRYLGMWLCFVMLGKSERDSLGYGKCQRSRGYCRKDQTWRCKNKILEKGLDDLVSNSVPSLQAWHETSISLDY